MDNLTRRGFLKICLALGAAPAIVRASSLMQVKARLLDAADVVWAPVGAHGLIASTENIYTFDTIWAPGPAVTRTITGNVDAKVGTTLIINVKGMPKMTCTVNKITGTTYTVGEWIKS